MRIFGPFILQLGSRSSLAQIEPEFFKIGACGKVEMKQEQIQTNGTVQQ
jgi:hypothetical protein